jgi:hypothetical protein
MLFKLLYGEEKLSSMLCDSSNFIMGECLFLSEASQNNRITQQIKIVF